MLGVGHSPQGDSSVGCITCKASHPTVLLTAERCPHASGSGHSIHVAAPTQSPSPRRFRLPSCRPGPRRVCECVTALAPIPYF